MQSTVYACQIVMKLEFCRKILEKYPNKKFMKIRPVGSHMFHANSRMDRHDKANSRFSQFCERATNFIFCIHVN